MTTTDTPAVTLSADDLARAAAAVLAEAIRSREEGLSQAAHNLAELSTRLSQASSTIRYAAGDALWHDRPCPLCSRTLDPSWFEDDADNATCEHGAPTQHCDRCAIIEAANDSYREDDDPIDPEHYA